MKNIKNIKNLLKFILFLAYTISIFFITNYYILALITLINILLMIVVKVNIVKAIQNLLAISPLILLATIINIFVVEPKYGILIGVRLILVCNITYTFSKVLSPVQIAKVIEMLVYPLKIFRINPADIGLIVTIGISFLPILRDTFNQNMMALKVKGVKLKPTNIIVSLRPIFISTLKRVDEIEYALKAKGYQG